MKAAFIVSLGLCVAGLVTRTAYEILKKDGKVDTRNKAIFAVVFVAMCLMLASWIVMCPLDPWRINLPDAVRVLGVVVLAAGLGIAITGLIQLRALENTDHLVTHGLYSKLRHPMYTGFILWILGWVIVYGAIVSLLIGVFCIGNIIYWRRLEEHKLLVQYGEEYVTYRRRTLF